MNLPIALTLCRIALIPLFVVIFYLNYNWANQVATGIFILAAVTDWLDGYLARKYNQESAFGAFLDPVADKLMVAAALVLLVDHHASAWITVPAMIIIAREITVSALREWMAEMGKRASVAVSRIGKVKTGLQMGSITLLLASENGSAVEIIGIVTLLAAAALTIWSMWLYLKVSKKYFVIKK